MQVGWGGEPGRVLQRRAAGAAPSAPAAQACLPVQLVPHLQGVGEAERLQALLQHCAPHSDGPTMHTMMSGGYASVDAFSAPPPPMPPAPPRATPSA